jgi:cytidylate kinase
VNESLLRAALPDNSYKSYNRVMKLIGISGTNGSGKDSVAELLQREHEYLFVSGSDMLREEAKKRNLPVERTVLGSISAEWRRESGLGVLIDKAIDVYNAKGGDNKYNGLVVASLRNPGEADRTHELGGQVVWIDADPKIRYERIFSRQRTTEDSKTYEQFLAEEQAEMKHSGDSATLSMQGVADKADIVLKNEGSSLEELSTIVENELLSKL